MLKKGSEIVSLSGISMVDINDATGVGKIAMQMSARIDLTSKRIDITETIENAELYDKHYAQIENDYAEFRKYVKEEREQLLAGLKEGD